MMDRDLVSDLNDWCELWTELIKFIWRSKKFTTISGVKIDISINTRLIAWYLRQHQNWTYEYHWVLKFIFMDQWSIGSHLRKYHYQPKINKIVLINIIFLWFSFSLQIYRFDYFTCFSFFVIAIAGFPRFLFYYWKQNYHKKFCININQSLKRT